ncbi:MAG: hypothetical protein SGI99_05220 [Pseudomonadota bacterium]|nr:hypothetical protein [Pseudomonadota bacterium]
MKRYVLLGVLVIASVAGWWLFERRGVPAQRVIAGSDPTAADAQRVATGPQGHGAGLDSARDVTVSAQPPGSAPRDAQYFLTAREDDPDFRTSPDVPLPELPPPDASKRYPGWLEAQTPEEAVWLDQHSYPTQEELDALGASSALDLAQRAANGDLAALALLGEKQLDDGDVVVGYNNLNEAALQGSIWAILMLADRQRQVRNYGNALALYNLAALRGDWVSPSLHMIAMPIQLHQNDFADAPRQTARFFATMQYLRQQRGLPPLVNTPRPNIFNRQGGLEPIGVYRRR